VYWAHVGVLGCLVMYCNALLVLLLHLECDGNAVGEVQAGTVMLYCFAVLDESDVSKSLYVGTTLFGLWDFQVFTRPHCEEESNYC
jgi:hypothetical protein